MGLLCVGCVFFFVIKKKQPSPWWQSLCLVWSGWHTRLCLFARCPGGAVSPVRAASRHWASLPSPAKTHRSPAGGVPCHTKHLSDLKREAMVLWRDFSVYSIEFLALLLFCCFCFKFVFYFVWVKSKNGGKPSSLAYFAKFLMYKALA